MKQNPRRAYNKDGTEIQLATVGGYLARGLRCIGIICSACGSYKNGNDVGEPQPEAPIPDICLGNR